MKPPVLTVLLFLAIKLIFTHVQAYEPLVQILNFMENEHEVFIISTRSKQFRDDGDSMFKEAMQNLTVAYSFGAKIDYSGRETDVFEELSKEGNPQVTKIIADMETLEQTLNFFAEIGDPRRGFQNETENFWFLILWPDNGTNLASPAEKEAELYRHLNSSSFATQFPASSQVYVGFPRENVTSPNATNINQLFEFFEIYGLGEKLVVRQVYELGNTFLNCFSCETQTKRRSNLQGIHLRVEGVEDAEFRNDTDYAYDEKTKTIKLVDGFSVQLLHMLQDSLNFTYTGSIMSSVVAHGLGEANAWDGVIQRVEKGQVDVGVSSTVYVGDRWRRIYFLPPTDENVISAFFRPAAAGIRDIFLHPFKLDLWAAVFSTWMILAFSMILFSAILKHVGAVDPDSNEPDFTETSLIWALATVCQQGWDDHPSSTSMRIIFIAASFTGVVAYAGYSAAIVSTLSSKNDPIQTPQALIDSGLSVGMRSGFLDTVILNNETDDVITRIYKRLSKNPVIARVNTTTGYIFVETSDYAFISVRDTFYDTVGQIRDDKQICTIRDLPILARGFPSGPFLSKLSPYKEYFRTVITRIRERGTLWRLSLKYKYLRRCLIAQEEHQGQALGANDVFTAFMILLGGYVLSLTFLAVEKLAYISRMNYTK